MHFLQDDKGGL